jgi:hypothetical protein
MTVGEAGCFEENYNEEPDRLKPGLQYEEPEPETERAEARTTYEEAEAGCNLRL